MLTHKTALVAALGVAIAQEPDVVIRKVSILN